MTTDANQTNGTLLERVAEAHGIIFFVFTVEESKLTYLNPAFSDVFGLDAEEVKKDTQLLINAIFPDDLAFLTSHFQEVLNGEEQKRIEFRLMHSKKGLRWIRVAGKKTKKEDEIFISGLAEDITHQKEYLYNLIKFNTKKNSTLEILSHDLAAPFANIQGLVNILEKQDQPDAQKVKRFMGLIMESAQRGSDMIRDFVNNEFLESAQVTLHKERLDIVHRLEVLIDNYKQGEELIDKQFELVVHQKPIFMYVDEMKFMQVVNNIVSNAIKFTYDNGKITITVEDLDDGTLITVADNGIGIPDEFQPLLFDKFTKARRPGLRGEKSVGMGMSIIKNIVELHKGKIWFKSAEGQGSVFYLQIPKE